jgi:hypothetical protein
VPRRSFLVDPLTIWGKESMEVFLKENSVKIMEGLILNKGVKKLLSKIGYQAKKIVKDAFESSGHGNWATLAESTIKKKGNDRILIDTSQLKESISMRVDKGN